MTRATTYEPQVTIFRDMKPYTLADRYQRFGGPQCLNTQDGLLRQARNTCHSLQVSKIGWFNMPTSLLYWILLNMDSPFGNWPAISSNIKARETSKSKQQNTVGMWSTSHKQNRISKNLNEAVCVRRAAQAVNQPKPSRQLHVAPT